MKIRGAELTDKGQFMELVRGLYLKSAVRMVKKWDKEYENIMNGAFVAEIDDKIVGYIAFGPQGDSLYIGDLYVRPKYRKGGVATSLVNYVNKLKVYFHVRSLRVDVRKKDKPAQRLYKKLGFNIIGEKGVDLLKLEK